MDMLQSLKGLLGIKNNEQDGLLQFVLDDAIERVKNYCNINEIPSGLKHTVVRIAADIYRSESYGEQDTSIRPGVVKSVKRGDETTSFDTSSTASKAESSEAIVHEYKGQLNAYRKVRWR